MKFLCRCGRWLCTTCPDPAPVDVGRRWFLQGVLYAPVAAQVTLATPVVEAVTFSSVKGWSDFRGLYTVRTYAMAMRVSEGAVNGVRYPSLLTAANELATRVERDPATRHRRYYAAGESYP